MHFDCCAVQANGFHSYIDDSLKLQGFEKPLQHAVFTPSVHAHINSVPVSESLWQSSPFTAIFSYIEDGVNQLEIAHANVPSLARQVGRDGFKLFFCEFHACIIQALLKISIV